ncbi:zinc finger protein SHOOT GRAVITROPISM 5-like [Andrographis paniculata]|uniref:zinc finger protein SHOOT GRAVITROPISM 5-like n=1 Tax=Andrographis paniculata TaxID=175694 RepID=UPI0021E8F638|nr:zinc finger protein SHOOT GRAVITROPISM 5-like [Andrographis paniculata]
MENHQYHYHHQEMQLLPSPNQSLPPNSSSQFDPSPPSLDLQLSISLTPLKQHHLLHHHHQPTSDYSSCVLIKQQSHHVKDCSGINNDAKIDSTCVEALKWQAAEQIRLAAMEKAYAERVMELTRREMELAQSEFARARALWARAMEEVERAEKIKERATHRMDHDHNHDEEEDPTSCMEITCFSCRQKFRPN